jgi:repressor of nif and glnA expression
VQKTNIGFFDGFCLVDDHPSISDGQLGAMTICSITMDGVLQQNGIPTRIAYGGRLEVKSGKPTAFADLIGYKGCTIDPLFLFLSSGLTSIESYLKTGTGTVLANIRQAPKVVEAEINEICMQMHQCGFSLPIYSGKGDVFRYRADPYRLSLIQYSGMNFVGYAKEQNLPITTDIGAGTIPFSKIAE